MGESQRIILRTWWGPPWSILSAQGWSCGKDLSQPELSHLPGQMTVFMKAPWSTKIKKLKLKKKMMHLNHNSLKIHCLGAMVQQSEQLWWHSKGCLSHLSSSLLTFMFYCHNALFSYQINLSSFFLFRYLFVFIFLIISLWRTLVILPNFVALVHNWFTLYLSCQIFDQ